MSLDDIDLYQVRMSLDTIKERAYEILEVSNTTEFWKKFGNCLVPALSFDELDETERREFLSSVTYEFIEIHVERDRIRRGIRYESKKKRIIKVVGN